MISVDHVSKCYRIGSKQASLRETVAELPALLLRRHRSRSQRQRFHWALDDVDFTVARGEALGIVGHNGAGKTTILKLLSNIIQPTSGSIGIEGRVCALIELGAGFHPELTGRENIYLNGTILGLRRREIDHKLSSIVDFAELSDFIDTPVKRYSSGMYARLGFAVAAHADPDVLLVDEVLAVGDANFQQKCFDYIHSFVNSGKTTVFVSHNLYACEQLCDRLLWLDGGRIRAIGNPGRVLENYLSESEEETSDLIERPHPTSAKLDVIGVSLGDSTGLDRDVFSTGEDIMVKIEYKARESIRRPHFCIWVSDTTSPSPLFSANMLLDGSAPEQIEGRGVLECHFRRLPLMPRAYYLWVEVWGEDRAELLFQWQRLAAFRIAGSTQSGSLADRRGAVRFTRSHGPVRVAYEWRTVAHTAVPDVV
jgi:lipopolysaccharide transport system ATP-binding protein